MNERSRVRTLDDVLGQGAPEAPALIAPEEGISITRAQLVDEVDELARAFASIGVVRGDSVAFVLPNGPECIKSMLAIASLGAAFAPLNPAYTAEEHAFYIGDIKPRVVVVGSGEGDAARAATPDGVGVVDASSGPDGRMRIEIDGSAVAASASRTSAEPDDIALILHTSGTTSRPKQVPLLQRNLVASAQTIAEFYALGPDDVSLCIMPLFHIHGLVASTLAALAGGGSVVAPRRVAPRRVWQQLNDHAVTWFSAGPTLHHMLLDRVGESTPPASLRFTRSCSSALSPALFERAESVYGVPMLEAYGMTEASHQMSSNPLPPAERIVGSVGIASGTEIAIADADGRFLPSGEAGEVCIRGNGVTPGYLENPEANASAFFDGWFRTGDQGTIDENGYLRIVGRLKEMILRGGENISPLEIEEALLGHPAVAEAVVFGVADEKYGEIVGAAVSLSGEATEAELIDYSKERLAAFKVPAAIHVLDEIPRTPTGKIQRRRIAEAIYPPDAGSSAS